MSIKNNPPPNPSEVDKTLEKTHTLSIPLPEPPAPPAPCLYSLFPPNSVIEDFGYDPQHPLRLGQFVKPLLYDGINIHGLNLADSDEEYDYDYDYDNEDDRAVNAYSNYHPYTSPVNQRVGSSGVGSATSYHQYDSLQDYDDPDLQLTNHNNVIHNDFNDNNEANDGYGRGQDIEGGYDGEADDDDGGEQSSDEINRRAIALFDFTPENDNEVGLTAGQLIWISYRHGQGWLVAEDPATGENGLVPEEYVEILYDKQEVIEDIPKPFLPALLQTYDHHSTQPDSDESDSEWVDTEYEVDEDERQPTVKDQDVQGVSKAFNQASLS